MHPIIFNKKANDQPDQAKIINIKKMEEQYRAEIKIKFDDFYSYLSSSTSDSGKLESIKSGILALRVPTKYKDLHLKLVLAIDKLENYGRLGKLDDKKSSQNILDQIKIENKWIL